MAALGVLLLIVWAVLAIFGEAIEIVLKVSLGLIVVGVILDVLTGFRTYTHWRR